MDIDKSFWLARKAGVPLVAVTTSEPEACITGLKSLVNGPVFRWDCVLGLRAQDGDEKAKEFLVQAGDAIQGSHRIERALAVASGLPEDSALFLINAHMFLNSPEVIQSIWNLRDEFKSTGSMLVMLAPQITIPMELRDTVVMDEELPDVKAIEEIIKKTYNATNERYENKLPKLKSEEVTKAAEILTSMSAFIVEQSVAMGISEKGLNKDILWEQKKQAVKQIKGLSVDEGNYTLADIGGNKAIVEFGNRLFNGNEPPVVLVRVEEIEKKMGSEGDGGSTRTSDVGADALDVYLNAMEDNFWSGILVVGPPGTGKSWFAKCLANTYGAISISQDINATRSKYVGESEMYIRENVKAIKAMAGSRAFFVATANSIKSLPAALRRRFWMGVYFFDLPDEEEQLAIWKISLAKRPSVKMQDMPNYKNWTGAEIRNCVEFAWRFNCSLKEAAMYIVPIATSNPESVKELRESANGRFLSASYKGTYKLSNEAPRERKVRV